MAIVPAEQPSLGRPEMPWPGRTGNCNYGYQPLRPVIRETEQLISA